ncbi:MAG TPA: SDR family oxidoreductase [Euzebyales bacterium]|nr:SDR family oxidoreductase [Euzebyales bacterium]
MARKLAGSVVVITGASSGIGRATAVRFAGQGAHVVLAARRDDALDQVALDCEEAGGRALAVPTDVTDGAAVDALAHEAVAEFGGIDVWVNNAGVSVFGRFEDVPAEDFDRVVDINLLGCVRGTRAALSHFRGRGRGTVINVASVYGRVGVPFATAYAASKFGVVGFGEALRQELLEDQDIHVTTILPAAIDTPFFQHAANYLGRRPRPPRPVHDAEIVAEAIVRCARKPQRERVVGGAGRLMRQQRAMAPKTFEKVHRRMTEHEHFEDAPAAPTSGNLHEPVASGTQVSGGWASSRAPLRRKLVPLLVVGTGVVVARRAARNGS